MDEKRRIGRREFIKDMTAIGLGIALTPSIAGLDTKKASAQGMSKLVIASHEDAVTGVRVNAEIAKQLVDESIIKYTGQSNIAEAWKSMIPSLSAKDTITIKVNCINSSLSSHPEVANAIAKGLIDAGAIENNIIIWDRTNHELIRSGYEYNISETGIRCFGSDERGWGYDKQVKVGNRSVRLSKLITNSTHIINVPVLKDHGMAGVTISMKNHYGSIDNPGNLHDNECDPYVAELNNVPEIKEKTRLIVLDGLLGIYIGGPGGSPQFAYKSIIVGQDPVAIDYQGWKIIESERQKRGMALEQPRHIRTAVNLGLGTNDPNNIAVESINIKKQISVNLKDKKQNTWGKIKQRMKDEG